MSAGAAFDHIKDLEKQVVRLKAEIDRLNMPEERMRHDIAYGVPLTVKCGYVYRLDRENGNGDRGFLFQNGAECIFIQPVYGQKEWEAEKRPSCVPACADLLYEHVGEWCEGMIENGVRIWKWELFPQGS